jgi:hypothetical protein
MRGVLITLTPGRRNKFINCQKAKVCIEALSIMDVNTCWNSTLELPERADRLPEFTHKWLQNPKYCEYWALFTSQDEWTIVTCVMEILRVFRDWTLRMLKRCPVTLHHLITVYSDMLDHRDGVTRDPAKVKTKLKENLFFAVKLAQQMLSKYYA